MDVFRPLVPNATSRSRLGALALGRFLGHEENANGYSEISRRDVLAAIERIQREGVPPGREATRYALTHEGRLYPPKYAVSLAVANAAGKQPNAS